MYWIRSHLYLAPEQTIVVSSIVRAVFWAQHQQRLTLLEMLIVHKGIDGDLHPKVICWRKGSKVAKQQNLATVARGTKCGLPVCNSRTGWAPSVSPGLWIPRLSVGLLSPRLGATRPLSSRQSVRVTVMSSFVSLGRKLYACFLQGLSTLPSFSSQKPNKNQSTNQPKPDKTHWAQTLFLTANGKEPVL